MHVDVSFFSSNFSFILTESFVFWVVLLIICTKICGHKCDSFAITWCLEFHVHSLVKKYIVFRCRHSARSTLLIWLEQIVGCVTFFMVLFCLWLLIYAYLCFWYLRQLFGTPLHSSGSFDPIEVVKLAAHAHVVCKKI